MERVANTPERLDGPLADAAALRGNLRDLRRINRLLGGIGLSRRAIQALIERDGPTVPAARPGIRVLDVGTGSADIPLALLDGGRQSRQPPVEQVVAVDSRPEIVEVARDVTRDVPGLTLAVADGRALPFSDGAMDVAHASLVLHHLEPPEAIAMLREMGRVASRGVVVNDLARGRWLWLGAWLLVHFMTTNRLTRHDGPLSVRRAYDTAEAAELVRAAGLEVVHEERGAFGHRWAMAAVPARRTGA